MTKAERIADLTKAIQRHKALAMLLTASGTTLEQAIDTFVDKLRAIRRDQKTVDQQIDQATAALNELLRAAPPEPHYPPCHICGHYGCLGHDHPGAPQSHPPADVVAVPEAPQSNQ